MSYLRHIHACNPQIEEPLLPWLIDGVEMGHLRLDFARHLTTYPDIFRFYQDAIHWRLNQTDFAERSAILGKVVKELSQAQHIPPLLGEFYPVTASGRESALAVIDRVAAGYFGLRAFGQHLNGYVRTDDGIKMWVGKRAQDRQLYPGALDNMVAGGVPYGLSLAQNLVKECYEEAGMSEDLARQARPVGVITYRRLSDRGLRPDVIYCYDIELSDDFMPENTDGEVESFALLPIDEIARLVHQTDQFKLNCNLVVVDFLLRHGFISPDDPDYLAINQGLRQFAV
jgi:8-oxo-dGTP pyrophosphatase MutT (NUDIX family)